MSSRVRAATRPCIAVGYLRVSTDDQALGPESQKEQIARWAQTQKVTVVAFHSDVGVSGGAELDRRPALVEAVQSLEQHRAGLLVVAKRDRLARDVTVAATIERLVESKGARVVAADGTNAEGPEGMLMRGMIDLFAQHERALIRSRTKAALAVKRSRGERVGEIPFGYRVEGDALREDEVEQAAITRLRELRSNGFTVRAIAQVMTDEAIPARGNRWHATTVARLLERSAA